MPIFIARLAKTLSRDSNFGSLSVSRGELLHTAVYFTRPRTPPIGAGVTRTLPRYTMSLVPPSMTMLALRRAFWKRLPSMVLIQLGSITHRSILRDCRKAY